MKQNNARSVSYARLVLFFVVSALVIGGVQASTWWVDDDWYGQGGDGSEARPFGTIQDALDNASFVAGDTVKVKAGFYDKGGRKSSSSDCNSRVLITKRVILLAVEGREKTFIVGASDPNSNGENYGMGDDATRCIYYSNSSDGGTRIEGFTICNGRTGRADDVKGYAAGVYDASGKQNFNVTDCTISNCIATTGGATRFGRLYRSLVTDCYATMRVSAVHGTLLHSCIVTHCKEASTSADYGVAVNVTAVNCTFFANSVNFSASNSKFYNCIIAGDGAQETVGTVTDTTTTAADGYHQLFAPAVGDYRPIAGSRAITLGNLSNIKQVTVYGYAYDSGTLTDYNGNTYPTSGTIAAGAIQEVAPVPAGGALQFDIDKCTVNGHAAFRGDYVYPETYPTQYVLAATEGTVYSYYRDVPGTNEMVVPLMDDTVLLMPPPSVAEVSTNTVQYAVAELYIDPVNGDDDYPGSAAQPFRTLQRGFDAARAGNYRVIHAVAGDYREGGVSLSQYQNGKHTATNRLCVGTRMAVRFKGAGAGRSFIYGAPDPTTATGVGPAAIRSLCVYSDLAIVQGFTLADSYSGNTGDYANWFAIHGRNESDSAHVADCVVTNCHGARAITAYIDWSRSMFIDNVSGETSSDSAWINYNGVFESCAFAGNTYRQGSSGLNRNNYSCSFSGNPQTDIPFGNNYLAVACAVEGCKELRSGTLYRGSVAANVTTAFNYAGVANDVVAFMDAAHGDFRVKSYSGAARCVPAPSEGATFWADYWRHACGDLEGRPLIIFPNGSILAGAVQEMVAMPGTVYVNAGKGGLGDGTAAYADGSEINVGGGTLAVSPAAGTRPCIGFTVDGETNLFADVASYPVSVPVAASGSVVQALYGTDWYVDAENGSDENYGYLPDQAKRTLAAALGVSGIASGDTVHAAAGTYAEGVMTNGVNTEMGSRALVPQGVTLKGAGAANTFIVGAAATVAADEYGCGTNAVRCVTLNRYATVQGFTLTGGRTCCHAGGKNLSDNLGAGVVGVGDVAATTMADRNVIDCVISNNIAYRGAAVYVTLRRTHVTGNRGTDTTGKASGTYYCRHYGCIVNNQLADYNVMYPYCVCESTLRENDGGYYAFYNIDKTAVCEIRNSLILGRANIGEPSSIATNTYFSRTPSMAAGIDVIGPGSLVANAASLRLDGEFRPVLGANVAIDRGDISLLPASDRATDIRGGQRVYNNALDIGAVEADWRAKYAADISGERAFVVTAASPEVEESAGVVQLPAGTTLTAQWRNSGLRNRNYAVALRLAEDSSVTVMLNGEILSTCSAAGTHELKFNNALALNALSFVCTSGGAEILSGDSLVGTIVTFR